MKTTGKYEVTTLVEHKETIYATSLEQAGLIARDMAADRGQKLLAVHEITKPEGCDDPVVPQDACG